MAPKTPQRRLTYQERSRIHALRHNAGWTYKRISQELQIPTGTVRHCALGPITPPKPNGGRKAILTTPIRQRLIAHATASQEQRAKSWVQVADELGIRADPRTITKAFYKEGYYRRVATEKPLLQPHHIHDRVFWTQLAINWTREVWNRIIWSDEATFRVGRGKLYVTRRAEEKYLPACCIPKFKDYADVHVWGCIGGDGSKGPLLIWDRDLVGNITSETYTRYITPLVQAFIQEHELFRVGIGNALFMQDNASPHRAIATKQYLHERAIRLLFWPANSPDLNPIENVWRLLKARVQRRYPKTKAELIEYLTDEWNKIDLNDIKKYTDSMHERCEAVLKAEGAHTPY